MQHFFSKNIRYLLEKTPLQVLAENSGIDSVELTDWAENKSEPRLSEFTQLANHLRLNTDILIYTDLQSRNHIQNSIKALFLDVDGVMTDGGMYYSEKGDEMKKFNTKDGMALKLLIKKGYITGFISSGFNSSLINSRAKLLGVHKNYTGDTPKTEIMDGWLNELNLTYKEIAYIGDDINDLPLIQKVGFSASPADAVNKVKEAVNLVLTSKGGEGCVRELVDGYFVSP